MLGRLSWPDCRFWWSSVRDRRQRLLFDVSRQVARSCALAVFCVAVEPDEGFADDRCTVLLGWQGQAGEGRHSAGQRLSVEAAGGGDASPDHCVPLLRVVQARSRVRQDVFERRGQPSLEEADCLVGAQLVRHSGARVAPDERGGSLECRLARAIGPDRYTKVVDLVRSALNGAVLDGQLDVVAVVDAEDLRLLGVELKVNPSAPADHPLVLGAEALHRRRANRHVVCEASSHHHQADLGLLCLVLWLAGLRRLCVRSSGR